MSDSDKNSDISNLRAGNLKKDFAISFIIGSNGGIVNVEHDYFD